MSTYGSTDKKSTDTNGSVVDKIYGAAGAIRDEVSEVAGDVKDAAYGQYRSMKEQGAEQLGRIETYVKAHPLTSIGITLGVGYLVGSMCRKT
jgi:ElaB/YqjD/DUF883 family membrane-anchored ribosome-binding protein